MQTLEKLKHAKAKANGALSGVVCSMLIWRESGLEIEPRHWAELREVYDVKSAADQAVLDCLCPKDSTP